MNPVVLESVDFSWPGASSFLFKDLNLVFEQGQTVSLLGPNGAGKTTLLELILGWRSPCRGRVLLEGTPAQDMPARVRGRLMALVPQDERMPFSYSVLEYILLGRAPFLAPLEVPGRRERDEALSVLNRVGIGFLANRKIDTLSGGEKRLVLVARALVQRPRILLLDEPANHLDPANKEKIKAMLGMLRHNGITVIFSSHEPDFISCLPDQVVLLKAGHAPEMGPAEKMLVPEKLSELYAVPVRVAALEGRRVILWGS